MNNNKTFVSGKKFKASPSVKNKEPIYFIDKTKINQYEFNDKTSIEDLLRAEIIYNSVNTKDSKKYEKDYTPMSEK